ncbi:MAG: MG2 domain-containing protein, partial [Gemmataceae bacterium]
MLQEPNHVEAHVDDYLHELLSPADVAYVERHCESCASCRAALDEAERRLHQIQVAPAYEASDELVRRTSKFIDNKESSRQRFRLRFAAGYVLTAAASVLVLVAAQRYFANVHASSLDLRLLGQSSLLSGSKGSLRVQLADRRDGQPRAGVPVDVTLVGEGKEQSFPLASFTTNEDGTYPVGFDIPDAEGDWQLRVVAHLPEGDEVIERGVQLVRAWKLMLSSDKPVYRPGQAIKLRALALRRPDLRPGVKEKVEFAITDPKGNLIYKQERSTSAYGIAAAECPLASEVTEGGYTITCRIGKVESKRRVEVNKYVLPRFKVDLSLDLNFYEPGQPVRGEVQVDYFFGKPVANADVEVALTTETVDERGLGGRVHPDDLPRPR